MKERIILAPGINGNELIKNLALHGVNTFNTRIFSSGEFARAALMRSGITVTDGFIDSSEEMALIAESVKGNEYFGTPSYSDIRNLAVAVRRMRCLVPDPNEAEILKTTLSKGLFLEKNNALLSVYDKYMQLLRDKNLIDSVLLIRKAIAECGEFNSEFLVLEEYPLNPLENALIQKVSGGSVKIISIKSLYGVSDASLKIESIKNCYGASNEVETIISDIYAGKSIDECTVAVTDPTTYGQLFFDYALIYDIPMTFGCGVPIINSNPAKLLSLYYQWMTTGFFGAEAIRKILSSRSFDRQKLMELFQEQDNDFRWKSFYEYLGNICFTNRRADNIKKLDAFKKAVEEESAYIIEGESKEYKEYSRKVKCIPLLEIMAEELALPTEVFISKYANIRRDNEKNSEKMLTALDIAASATIYEELVTIRESGASQSDEDIIINILKMNVMSQKSEPGSLHITSIDKALSSIRKRLYIAGISASKYPGSPKENYLLLDSDLRLFGEEAEYQTSEGRIKSRISAVLNLAELASCIGSIINVSYSGMNVAELKRDNASSLIYELYSKMNGTSATSDDMAKAIINVDYFEPAISASRLVGKAYTEDKRILQDYEEPDETPVGWNIDAAYAPTAIETFYGCPRSFMIGYILGIPEPDEKDPFEVISVRDIGTMAHSLMEQLADNDMTLEEFMSLSREFFDRFIDEHPPLIPEKVEAVKNEFLDMMETAYKGDPHRKVVLKEVDIHCEHPTGVKLHGFPDRVEQLDDGSCLIVDFKTGRTVKHIEDDFETCFQIIVYAYLMESLGYKVSGGEFRYIRLGQTVKCRYDNDMKNKLARALNLFKTTMLAGVFLCDPTSCEFCKYKEICNVKNELDFWGGSLYDI